MHQFKDKSGAVRRNPSSSKAYSSLKHFYVAKVLVVLLLLDQQ